MFEIPTNVRELLENKQVPEAITKGLTKENYATYFNTLIIMEELHLEVSSNGYYVRWYDNTDLYGC